MKKTPLQEFIETIEEKGQWIPEYLKKEALKKEKDIIIQSWKEGWKQGANFSADPELYFTSNFLSNEEKS